MKQIEYRGGMLTFSLPESWKEEDYPEGGAAFYEGDPESGTLNLSLTTMQRKSQVDVEALREVVSVGSQVGEEPPEELANGNMLRRSSKDSWEGGKELNIVFWHLANAVPPRTARCALFAFAVPKAVAGSRAHLEKVEMLDTQIRGTQFTTLTPEEIRARINEAKRPWWRFW